MASAAKSPRTNTGGQSGHVGVWRGQVWTGECCLVYIAHCEWEQHIAHCEWEQHRSKDCLAFFNLRDRKILPMKDLLKTEKFCGLW